MRSESCHAADHVPDDWMLVGTIAAPVGLRGEVKIDLATDFPDRFNHLEVIYTGPDHVPMALVAARVHGGRVVLRLAAVGDRTAAEGLRGLTLYVRREDAVPLPEGHYYHDQIIGLRVVTTTGDSLGAVEEILHTGNNDVYVARNGQHEVLIPAIHDVVRQIDLAAGTLTVEVIEGLL